MRYDFFGSEEGAQRPGESDEAYMNRAVSAFFQPGDLHQVNEMLKAELVSCSLEPFQITARYHGLPWMLNPSGTVQGGVMTSAYDMTMGFAVRFVRRADSCITIQMNTEFMRAVPGGESFLITATVEKSGARAVFVSAKAWLEKDGKLLGTCSAVFA
ncbi:MAG: PaaI family thioesterase [Lachnospiraceae bacterium]|nr:PaaI family thioesterase [Lachnospiraceae bacterium]